MEQVFIAGGSGFVGGGIVEKLLEKGYGVHALVRNSDSFRFTETGGVTVFEGDPFDAEVLDGAMAGCSTVINSIGIIREKKLKGITFDRIHTELNGRILTAAKKNAVRRYMLISALGVRHDGISRYQTSKYAAECQIKKSGIQWTIFRPSFVIGPGAGFVSEISPIVRSPVIPVFGRGDFKFEPVDQRVLAEAVATSIDHPAASNAVFEIRGEGSHSWKDILREIAHALGKKKIRFIHFPVWFVRSMVFLFGWLPISPMSRDQLDMLLEGNTGNCRNAVEELKLDWIDLREAIAHAVGRA